jgi:CRISPR-associated protein Cmr5
MMQTRDQKIAAKIFDQVSALPQEDHQKYGTMAHKLPILVHTAGLVQALAFVDARGTKSQKKLLTHLAEIVELDDKEALLRKSRNDELDAYMQLSQRVLHALLWYKRFAQSVLGVEASDESEADKGD